jgi:hypothetical protein
VSGDAVSPQDDLPTAHLGLKSMHHCMDEIATQLELLTPTAVLLDS